MTEARLADEQVIAQVQNVSLKLRERTADVHPGGPLRRGRRVLQGMCSAALLAAILLGACAQERRDGQTVQQIPSVDRGSGGGGADAPPGTDEAPPGPDGALLTAGHAAPNALPNFPGGADRLLPNGAVAANPLMGDRTARRANIATMLDVLGPDWQVRPHGPRGDVEVSPGSSTARELPEAYPAVASLLLLSPNDGNPTLSELCRARTAQPIRWSSCTSLTLPDGRVVQLQDMRTDVDAANYAWDATLAFYEGPDGIVGIEFAVHDFADADPGRQAAAIAWLERKDELVATLAAHPYVEPRPASEPGT